VAEDEEAWCAVSEAGRNGGPVTTDAAQHSPAPDTAGVPVTGGDMVDADVLGQVLSALARGAGGEAGQRARMALRYMAARLCGRFSAEARAAEMACAGGEPDQVALSGVAALLAVRAGADPGFASGLVPWLAATRVLLAEVTGQNLISGSDRDGDPGM